VKPAITIVKTQTPDHRSRYAFSNHRVEHLFNPFRRNESKFADDINFFTGDLLTITLDISDNFIRSLVWSGIVMTRYDIDIRILECFWLNLPGATVKDVPDEVIRVERLDVRDNLLCP